MIPSSRANSIVTLIASFSSQSRSPSLLVTLISADVKKSVEIFLFFSPQHHLHRHLQYQFLSTGERMRVRFKYTYLTFFHPFFLPLSSLHSSSSESALPSVGKDLLRLLLVLMTTRVKRRRFCKEKIIITIML